MVVVIACCASRIKNDRFVPGRKVVPSAVPPSFGVCRTRCDRRADGVSTAADRRCPISLALCAGAYWRPRLSPPRVRSGGSRVHSLSSSSRLAPAAGSLGRRATGTRPVHSPFFVMWPGVCRRPGGRVKRRARDGRSRARNRGSGGRGGPDTAGTGGRSRTAGTAERPIRCVSRPAASGDTRRTGRAAATCGSRPATAIVGRHAEVAERVGFEPTKSLDSTLFKSAAINRSATSPGSRGYQCRVAAAHQTVARERQKCSDETTIVPPRRSGHPRRRESMKIQMNPM